MSDARQTELKRVLALRYDLLVARLTRRLGSAERARDALHDAYLRLERAQVEADLRHPVAYLLRMAANIAANTARKDRRLLAADEIEAILDVGDDAPDAERAVGARLELAAVERALVTMPPRRRAIVVASWIDLMPHEEIAARHGLALRTVQHELKAARDHLRETLDRSNVVPLRPRRRRVS